MNKTCRCLMQSRICLAALHRLLRPRIQVSLNITQIHISIQQLQNNSLLFLMLAGSTPTPNLANQIRSILFSNSRALKSIALDTLSALDTYLKLLKLHQISYYQYPLPNREGWSQILRPSCIMYDRKGNR